MNKPTPSLEAEIDALKETYAALNRNDIKGLVKVLDPQIVWMEPSEYPSGGTYHGLAAVKAHFAQARSTWAEGTCEAERFVAAGDKIVVFIYVHVRLKHESEWREGRHAAVWTFRNGKAIEQRIVEDTQQALEWAEVQATDASGLAN